MARLRIDDPEACVRILAIENEAKRNAVDPALLEAIRAAADDAAGQGVRCLVLTGSGTQAFCAGYDLNVLQARRTTEEQLPDDVLQAACRALERAAPPVIAAVNGHAYGAGAELAAACDLRVAAENARLAVPPAKLGIVYAPAGLQRFVELVGVSWTRRLFYTGDVIGAEKACEIGLVDEVVPEGEALPKALELAARIARNAPLAVQGMKRILSLMRRRDLPAAAIAEVEALRRASFASEDAVEGIAAVLERRTPRFTGR
ncbi:MAG TPA: enoyl-CoA hydratase/isomerase family protein [Vulgatibacter sp.]|nr:enoyl-CoA hydratase/isomerase family protein [Vulgatibacter sp.]